MDENNQNPYMEKNYKPQKPRKPGKGFGIASIVLGILLWSFLVIFVIINVMVGNTEDSFISDHQFAIEIIVGMPLATLAVIFGIIQKEIYEKTKMATAGIVLGVLFPIVLILISVFVLLAILVALSSI